MKICLIILFSTQVFAQVIQVREVQTNPHTFATTKVKVKTYYLSAQDRDKILDKYFPELVKGYDEVDRDIFYKSILNYNDDRLKDKYPHLSQKNLKELREHFKRL